MSHMFGYGEKITGDISSARKCPYTSTFLQMDETAVTSRPLLQKRFGRLEITVEHALFAQVVQIRYNPKIYFCSDCRQIYPEFLLFFEDEGM